MGGGQEMKPQVTPDHYIEPSYDAKERFISYWHQINEIISLNPKEVLEIGIGNGFVSKYLKERGAKIKTLDIDKKLNPDVAGSVLGIPFIDGSFEVVACYEVLEHLPYSEFSKALKEIHRISRKHVVLSLPDVTTVCGINIKMPKIRPIKRLFLFPFIRPVRHEFDGGHYFEIGKIEYPLKKIKSDIEEARFKIVKTYRVFEFNYHRFFVLEKR